MLLPHPHRSTLPCPDIDRSHPILTRSGQPQPVSARVLPVCSDSHPIPQPLEHTHPPAGAEPPPAWGPPPIGSAMADPPPQFSGLARPPWGTGVGAGWVLGGAGRGPGPAVGVDGVADAASPCLQGVGTVYFEVARDVGLGDRTLPTPQGESTESWGSGGTGAGTATHGSRCSRRGARSGLLPSGLGVGVPPRVGGGATPPARSCGEGSGPRDGWETLRDSGWAHPEGLLSPAPQVDSYHIGRGEERMNPLDSTVWR